MGRRHIGCVDLVTAPMNRIWGEQILRARQHEVCPYKEARRDARLVGLYMKPPDWAEKPHHWGQGSGLLPHELAAQAQAATTLEWAPSTPNASTRASGQQGGCKRCSNCGVEASRENEQLPQLQQQQHDRSLDFFEDSRQDQVAAQWRPPGQTGPVQGYDPKVATTVRLMEILAKSQSSPNLGKSQSRGKAKSENGRPPLHQFGDFSALHKRPTAATAIRIKDPRLLRSLGQTL